MITSSTAKSMVNDRNSYYDAMLRNGFTMPAKKSKINTIDFFEAVRKGLVYVPRYDTLVMRPCPNPPSKVIANQELVAVIQNGLSQVDCPDERKRFSNLVELIKEPG